METTQQTIANNKLIAEFMGYKINPSKMMVFDGISGQYFLDRLYYNSSWEWLMTVVEKITNQNHRFMMKSDEGQHYCEIWCYQDNLISYEIEVFEETQIGSVYTAILQFINWHNKTKPIKK